MAAEFKSHILRRDEKGFGGVPFKRVLLGGILGGLSYTVCRLFLPALALPLGIAVALSAIALTNPRGGLPLWLRATLTVRGRLILSAAAHPAGLGATIARALRLPTTAVLDGAVLFRAPASPDEFDLSDWETFGRPRDLDRGDGLAFVDSPLHQEGS
jgi:hypothetical protein